MTLEDALRRHLHDLAAVVQRKMRDAYAATTVAHELHEEYMRLEDILRKHGQGAKA